MGWGCKLIWTFLYVELLNNMPLSIQMSTIEKWLMWLTIAQPIDGDTPFYFSYHESICLLTYPWLWMYRTQIQLGKLIKVYYSNK